MTATVQGEEVVRRSFQLISKQSFAIETTASIDSFVVIVRSSPMAQEALWKETSTSGSSKIEVVTSDPNFHVG